MPLLFPVCIDFIREAEIIQYVISSDCRPVYLRFSVPHMHSWSRTVISDFPLSVSEYSTFGGICG